MTENFGAHSTADEILASVDLEGMRFLVTGGRRASPALWSRCANGEQRTRS